MVVAFVSFSVILVIGYSLLSARFFSLGVAQVIRDNMEITVDNYHRSVPRERRKDVDYWGSIRITTDWKQMPAGVREFFPDPVDPSGKLHIAGNTVSFKRPGADYYLLAVRRGNTVYYASQWAGFSSPLGIFGWNSMANIRFLIVLSCCIGMGIAIVLWLVMRQVSQPMIALDRWANGLNEETVKTEIPDFHYLELNGLASLLRGKIADEYERMERDQQFLHYASHELRTPVTIINQNVEVLGKVMGQDTEGSRMMSERALKRLGRAAGNMAALIETLLWLGRETTGELPRNEVRIDRLLKETVKSLAFLLKGKKIKVSLDLDPADIRAAEAPLRIVLANLVRNAFQHASGGRVKVKQTGGVIVIVNDDNGDGADKNLGFGFGLGLTSRLVRKMGWSYSKRVGPEGYTVTIGIDREQ